MHEGMLYFIMGLVGGPSLLLLLCYLKYGKWWPGKFRFTRK